METSLNSNTNVGLGFAVQPDPFQAGREAAQMAKNQISDKSPDLVLAFGPSGIQFQDFIEGVRLVTGEDALMGLSADRIVSNELFSPKSSVVVLIKSDDIRFSLASATIDSDNILAPITSLMSNVRTERGNTRQQYEHHGVMLFETENGTAENEIPKLVLAEAGLESWLIKIAPRQSKPSPLYCHDKVLDKGIAMLECMSNLPWGFGFVNIGAFKKQERIYQEAVKTALRDALVKMDKNKPAFGFLFFNFPSATFDKENIRMLFESAKTIVKDIPLVGISVQHPFVQEINRIDESKEESITVLLLPGAGKNS